MTKWKGLENYMQKDLKVGDTIKCHDADEMIEIMTALSQEDIQTDFMYHKDGQDGFWLKVEKIR